MKYSTNAKYEQLPKRSSGLLIDEESIGSTATDSSGKVTTINAPLVKFNYRN